MAETLKLPSSTGMSSQELTEEIIRLHAYRLFENRGYEHGHDFEDWLQAEAEVRGKKSVASAEPAAEPERVVSAAA